MSSDASTAVTSPATLAAQRAHEPSMEEILASIRRIIADDQMLPLTRTGATPAKVAEVSEPAPAAEAEAEVVEAPVAALAEPQVAEAAPEPEVAPVAELEPEPAPAVAPPPAPAPERKRPVFVAASPRPAPVAASQAAEPQPVAVAPAAEEPLLSAGPRESVSSSFGALATTMFLQNTGMVEEALREMLRPMLKQWLDDNLPVMVERLVRAEIERVARGGRR